MLSFCNDSHQLGIHLPGLALTANIIKWDRCAAGNTACALTVHRAILRFALTSGHGKMDGRRRRTVIHVGINPGFFAFLFGKPPFAGQWHLRTTSRVGASYTTYPEPGNHGCFAATVFFRKHHLWVEMSDMLLGLVPHPLPIVANILS